MSNTIKAIDIANFFIQLAESINDNSIDNLKLNKMLYYAQGHCLAKYNRKLFDDEIQAWEYGPVVPEVYRSFKCCGSNSIQETSQTFDESKLTSDILDLLMDVYNAYGKYTGLALKEMTHQKGGPWDKVFERGKNHIISTDDMADYFKHEELKEFTLKITPDSIITQIPNSWDSEGDEAYGRDE